MDSDSIRAQLMVKPNTKVSLFHARKDVLPHFMTGDLNLMLDWAENECDSVIFWKQAQDDLCDIAAHLEQQIKLTGRIWLVLSGASKVDIEHIQQEITEYTNLWAGKVIAIGDDEKALQFVRRKSAMEDQNI